MVKEKRTGKSAKKASSSSAKSVFRMNLNGKKPKRYRSIAEASMENDVDPSSISKATRGIRKTAGGFTWRIA